jgi:hypothetical protein
VIDLTNIPPLNDFEPPAQLDQAAIDTADHALEVFGIVNGGRFTLEEKEHFGKEILRYAALRLLVEQKQGEAFEAGQRDSDSRARNRPGDGDMGG